MTFNTLLQKYRKFSFSERDKGDRFERLMQAYLLTDPKYAAIFKKVWLWSEFFAKEDLGGQDTGIDIVCQTFEGDFWAVQCKCFQEDSYIDKPAVDTFLSTSSRKFSDENLQTTQFAHRLWISTTNKWTSNAEEAIRNQSPPVNRINLYDLQNAPVDWEKLEEGVHGEKAQTAKKTLRPHQTKAVEDTHNYFKENDRGKLIMACGTGKTFTALRIAEKETNGKGLVLFLVPSIALLGQTLNEWYADAQEPLNAICICSDPKASEKRTKNEDVDATSVVDLALPASTDVRNIVNQFKALQLKQEISAKNNKGIHPLAGMTVVFSTYQSIEVISKAQKTLAKELPQYAVFDLIICDEAHRTTGVTLSGEDESAFVKVHDNDFLTAKKRLYMTATPRLYSDDTKSKAAQADAILCSMDDKTMYGDEIYRIGFGQAVDEGLLTDYKVLILTLNQNDVPPAVQNMIADDENEINTDDASKLIGCINALSKQVLGDDGSIKETDPEPMRRAVAFCQSIKISEKITNTFNTATESYIQALPQERRNITQNISSKHIDGTMNATKRNELMTWLKDEPEERECRVLTNVRCLSEGVDVPSLDAVMFLSARNSQVDVVQSVGRVMRKAPNKNYGYIIIPVVVPADVEADKALDNNERYKVVWTVLNALRAHDDRFNATVNKIELNRKKPNNILVGRPDISFDEFGNPIFPQNTDKTTKDFAQQLALQFDQLQNVVFAKMVEKVGDRRYWEQWAKSVAEIAERQIERIGNMIKTGEYKTAFEQFLSGLQKNINPGITETDAVEMLSQHIITKPVFEALFEGYSFVKNNPISVSMQTMLDLLETQAIEKDTETLHKFYESVKMRASGIDNAEGKQRIIIELYDKFFKTAFPKMVERLGIVYTPVEVVDFIIHSVNDVLKQEFGRTISDENVNILDPFTGTGTFITRLIQSGLINKEDLERKYRHELFANEIVLLAYYIAAVNIENAYHDLIDSEDYQSFEGICLTDTFQLGENKDSFSEMFPQNSERVERQKNTPITVFVGNPPYSVGQKSKNDIAQNQVYEKLHKRIEETFVKASKDLDANSNSLKKFYYDPYIKAFRWSADRITKNDDGIIAFVSNGGWINSNSLDGFRKAIEKEFAKIYVFNLRGNQVTSGELSRKEGGKIFGSGSRTPISITLLVKKNNHIGNAEIHYYDIGDYLSREQKLKIISDFKSVSRLPLSDIIPNENGDWVSQRSNLFNTLIELAPSSKYDVKTKSFFVINTNGVVSGRSNWVYNFSKLLLYGNINRTIDFFNSQVDDYEQEIINQGKVDVKKFINTEETKIKWDDKLISKLVKGHKLSFDDSCVRHSFRTPFCKEFMYFNENLNWSRLLLPKIFPTKETKNLVISCIGKGASRDFSVLISNSVMDYHFEQNGQCFPLYYYEEDKSQLYNLFEAGTDSKYIRRDAISNFILERAQKQYGKNVTKEDIFYYVYGFLHSPQYRETFASDLKKMLPRLPLVEEVRDFWAFSKAGRKLAALHLNYEGMGYGVQGMEYEIKDGVIDYLQPEKVEYDYEYPMAAAPEIKYYTQKDFDLYRVEKMRFPKKEQKDTIIYNSRITIINIPEVAYEYVVNGKSAIEWIMERYKISEQDESGITNNPNDWSAENKKPRYILDLLLSVINVSIKTVEIVKGLPEVKFEE